MCAALPSQQRVHITPACKHLHLCQPLACTRARCCAQVWVLQFSNDVRVEYAPPPALPVVVDMEQEAGEVRVYCVVCT